MTGKMIKDSIGLKWRLIIVVSLLLVGSCTILSVFLMKEFSDAAVTSLELHARSLSQNLALNSEFGVMLEIKPELDAFVTGLVKGQDVTFAQVYNKDGVLLSQAAAKGTLDGNIRALDTVVNLSDRALFKNGTVVSISTLRNGTDVIDAVSPVLMVAPDLSKEELGSTLSLIKKDDQPAHIIGYARVGVGLEQTYARVKDTTRVVVIFTLLLVVVGVLLSVTLVKMVSKPIGKLVEATELIAAGDLSQRVSVTADRELGRLAEAFNKMCDSLLQTQKEIESYNQTLEQRIAKRTRELQDAQEQIVQSEKMAAVGQLAAGVAHELNNPLGGILGYAQFGLEKLDRGKLEPEDVADYKRYLADIEQQARRCKMIVKNLLKFSRASTQTEFELFDINTALEETFVFSAHQLNMKNIALVKKLADGLPKCYGNPNLLQQVFTNLLINAMQSMQEGGELQVETWYDPAPEWATGQIKIAFRDTGFGIAEENLSKIFEPFFTTKKVGEGTGLGLSVSYGIVKEHGGDIKIDSVVGEGSTFTIILPIVRETARSATT